MANNNRQQAIQEIQRNARLRNICSSLGRDVKRIGKDIKTLCPFHDDHDPSLHIYENNDGDQYHCYACGAHGNVFEYVKRCLGVDFSGALSWLANYTGIHLPTAQQRRTRILAILNQKGPMTAQEVADELYNRGHTLSRERNHAAPRLTELKDAGLIEATGKKICQRTGRKVTVWAARKVNTTVSTGHPQGRFFAKHGYK